MPTLAPQVKSDVDFSDTEVLSVRGYKLDIHTKMASDIAQPVIDFSAKYQKPQRGSDNELIDVLAITLGVFNKTDGDYDEICEYNQKEYFARKSGRIFEDED